MVALIPRRNSLAVSGTPAKSDIKDLVGSLKFLRVPVLPHNAKLWLRIQQPTMRSAFESLFSTIAVRTTKAQVRHAFAPPQWISCVCQTNHQVQAEFEIPSQSRYVVPVDLSAIERHYYDDTRERQVETIRRYQEGRGVDRAVLRQCLLTLRQICTHVQVGQMAAGAGGAKERGVQRLKLGSALMTMKEALQKMKADHAAGYLLEGRNQVS